MAGNTFGEVFRVTTFGESHNRAVGVIVDGCPAGLELSSTDVQRELDKRKPGQSKVTTQRAEEDKVEILSGVFDGKTLGTPIAMVVHNKGADSSPYEKIKNIPRPGHADYTFFAKYGIYDYRGGGRASGRETVSRVAAGAIAKKLLKESGIEILGYAAEIHGVKAKGVEINEKNVEKARKNIEKSIVRCPDSSASEKMIAEIEKARKKGDSVGGIIETIALGVPHGLGEPVFDKLDGDIAKAIMSIGAVKGVEIGAGFAAANMLGSEHNDEFLIEKGKIKTKTNNAGGILGGISTGMPIVVKAAVKPTSSISKKQKSVNMLSLKNAELEIKGKHDPCIVPRAVPVCEAMLALVLADHLLRNRASRV